MVNKSKLNTKKSKQSIKQPKENKVKRKVGRPKVTMTKLVESVTKIEKKSPVKKSSKKVDVRDKVKISVVDNKFKFDWKKNKVEPKKKEAKVTVNPVGRPPQEFIFAGNKVPKKLYEVTLKEGRNEYVLEVEDELRFIQTYFRGGIYKKIENGKKKFYRLSNYSYMSIKEIKTDGKEVTKAK